MTAVPVDEAPVTATEIAADLHVSLDTIYRLAHSKELPAFRVGRQWRFYRSAVKAHLTRQNDPWAQPKRSAARKRVA